MGMTAPLGVGPAEQEAAEEAQSSECHFLAFCLSLLHVHQQQIAPAAAAAAAVDSLWRELRRLLLPPPLY